MKDLTTFLQHVSGVGFGLVGLLALLEWWRRRDRETAYLALALGLFGAVSLMGEVLRDTGLTRADGSSTAPPVVAAILGLLSLGMFMACGYALLLFRHALLPLSRRVLWGTAGLVVLVTLLILPLTFDPSVARSNPALALAAISLLFLVWIGCVGEPVYRLWRVSRRRPAVQRARLRALATGYGIIIVVLVFAVGVASANPGKPNDPNSPVNLIVQLTILVALPILYVSFAPPRWLRRAWRASEEEAFSDALHDLLLESPDTHVLTDRALAWAIRLVGADGGVVLDADGTTLAARSMDDHLLQEVSASPQPGREGVPSRLPDGHRVMAIPLTLSSGTGRMVVVAGSLTPALAGEEGVRLSQYAVSVAAAIDRMRLVEAVRRSEDELRNVNRDLEGRVLSRTAELELSNRELQASNRELEAFSYTVSHDLRSPLRAIDGFTRILTEEHGSKLDPDAARYLDLVAENARGMGSLIDTMLTFSRMGRQPLTLQKVEPREIAQRVADRVLVDLENRVVEITVNPLPAVQSDPVLVEQLFSNLVGNAVKFTRERKVAKIEVGVKPDPDAPGVTSFYVKDNGIGFDPRYAHKLFGVFQRLHRAEEYEGFGAGLAIVERIVTRHGGRAWAESVQGEGATFYFTLQPAPAGVLPAQD
ncbi:MAG: hypothetical protein QOK05_2534 [Chloroflexota bacterium]|nr:hypothetical protein [Chloroflexota bacterium]